MIQKLKLIAGASLAALVLAACGNTVDPIDPFPQEDKIPATATTSGTDPVVTGTSVAAGDSVLFEVTIPPQVIAMDYVWFELSTADGIDELILYDSVVGTPRVALVSTETGWFDTPAGHSGEAPPALTATGLEPADINLSALCAGPCLSHATADNIGTTRYLRVSADADTSFDLYVYGGTVDEQIGLSRQTAQELDSGQSIASAIIWSGMEQWYHVPEEVNSVTLSHSTADFGAMAFQADVFLGNELLPAAVLSASNPSHEFIEGPEAGIYIRVYAYNGSRAAQAGHARYNIAVEGLTVIPIKN